MGLSARDAVEQIRRAVPSERVLVDPEVMAGLSQDQAVWAPVGLPAAVVRVASTAEVQAVVQACIRYGVPIVPRGAGTGLSGGANAVDGCVVVSTERMNTIVEVDALERLAVVQPGVVNDDLRAAVADYGLWYPPDPASSPWSTIGGNVATNAGGVCCAKYGVTRDYVIGLELVNPLGEVVRVGRRTAKGVAGYDLVGLMVGSEGTLGVVTEITVKLRPLPPNPITVAAYFDTLSDAGAAIEAVAAAGLTPSALELVDRHCLAAVDAWKNMGLSTDAQVVLLGRVDEPGEAGAAAAEEMAGCFRRAGATWAERSTDEDEAEALFAARRLAFPALERLGPVLTEDVCVPKGRVAEMLGRIEEIALSNEVTIANIAHAGDGNLHPLLITPLGDEAARARAQNAFEQILAAALELGGTVTGEHGIGLLKRPGLDAELSMEVLQMHRAIKRALDPANLFNPGKIFDA